MVRPQEPLNSSAWPVESIIDALTGKDLQARQEAEEALEKIGEPAIDGLVNRLRTGKVLEHRVRIAIVRILGNIGWQPSNNNEKALFHIARQEWPELTAVGPDAVEPLLEILQDNDQPIRKEAAMVLGDIADARAVEPLLAALKDVHSDIRIEAASALGKIKDILAVEPLTIALDDGEPKVGKTAFQALSAIVSPEASRILFNRLKVVKRHIAEPLLKLLDKRGWQPSTPAETALFHVAHRRWEELLQLGKDAVEPLLNVLNQDDHLVRREAIRVLGDIADSRAVKPLILELNDEHDVIREAAVEALKKIGPSHLAAPLSGALSHKLALTRQLAAEILDETGWKPADNKELARYLCARRHWHILDKLGEDAIDPLLQALQDGDPQVRAEAAVCLGKTGAILAVIPLVNTLGDEKSEVVNAVQLALSMFRSPEAVEPLIQSMENAPDSNRADATLATVADCLGTIGDALALPHLYRAKESLSHLPENNMVNINSVSTESPGEVIDRAIDNIQANLTRNDMDLICASCFCWFVKHKIKLGFLNKLYYYACPKCHHNGNRFKGVDRIDLAMTYGLHQPWKLEKNLLTVNWHLYKEPFDYDVIHIENAGDHDIEEMVLKLANDPNKERRKRMHKTACYLSPDLKLSQSRINLLKNHFKVIKEKEALPT